MEHPSTRGFGAYVGAALLIAAPFGVYYVYPVRVIFLAAPARVPGRPRRPR